MSATKRLIVLLGVVAVAAVLAPLAFAHPYTATLSKTTAGTGDTDTYTYTITNLYSSQKAAKAEITIPAGWAVSNLSASSNDAPAVTWAASISSGKIVVTPSSGGLAYNKVLKVVFDGKAGASGDAICAGGTSTWTPRVTNGSTVFGLTGSVPKVTVSKPGRLASFTWTTQPADPQQAGQAFTTATVTAKDGCGNVKTNYAGALAVLSGNLGTSPGFSADPAQPGTPPSYGLSWSAGVGTATVTAYAAEKDRWLKVAAGLVDATSTQFAVNPGPLGRFTVDPIASPQVAGTSFTFTARAFDAFGNAETNYSGAGALLSGTLGTSPGFPSVPGTPPSYGPLSWSTGGVGTATVTAYKAEIDQNLTIADGQVSRTSNLFAVIPGPLTLAFTPFSTNPGLAKVSEPVHTNPVTGTPVTVTATDAWGNFALPNTQVSVSLNVPNGGGPLVNSTTEAGTASGVASFDNLRVGTVATGYSFSATATGAVGATSGPFNVSNDLAPCSGSSCSNTASLPSGQVATTSLTAGGTPFSGEYLLTTFSTDPLAAPPGACDGLTPVGAGGDISVTGGAPTASKPTFTITLTVPAAVLNPSKQAWQYDVCLGAKSFDAAAPWKTKTLVNFFTRKNAVFDGERYWGLVPRCIWVSGDPTEFFLNFLPIPATNPCIVSKTRPAGGDLTIVLRKPYPWDGRWGIDG